MIATRRHQAAPSAAHPVPPSGQSAAGVASATSSSLIDHNLAAAASSRAAAEGVLGLHLTKYQPVTSVTSGDDARYTDVRAPCSGVRMNGLITFTPKARNPVASPSRAYPVATVPGCRQLAVTPVPTSLRASSSVKRMLASFDRP